LGAPEDVVSAFKRLPIYVWEKKGATGYYRHRVLRGDVYRASSIPIGILDRLVFPHDEVPRCGSDLPVKFLAF